MTWYHDVSDIIIKNIDTFAESILSGNVQRSGKGWFVDPCPFCGHQGSFHLTKGVNAYHCFSGACGASGTLIQLAENVHGKEEGRKLIEAFTNIPYPYKDSPEKEAAKQKNNRMQKLYETAIDIYHARLLMGGGIEIDGKKMGAGEYQESVRKHEYDTLVKYKVGYSIKWPDMVERLKKAEFTEEEIKKSEELLKFPEGYFLYPYYDDKRRLVRINAKYLYRQCWGSKNKDGGFNFDCSFKTLERKKEVVNRHTSTNGHTMSPAHLSKGDKNNAYFYNPKALRNGGTTKKKAILVEGEDDVLSTDETLSKIPKFANIFVVIGIGGNPPSDLFEAPFFRQFEEIYEAFDNDPAGDGYRDLLDKGIPEMPLKRMTIADYADIDELLKHDDEEPTVLLEDIIENATTVPPKHFLLQRVGKRSQHMWEIKNRHFGITYEISRYLSKKLKFEGVMVFYKNGYKAIAKNGDIDNIAPPAPQDNYLVLKSALSDKLQSYYHNDIHWVDGKPNRSFKDLLDIYKLSKVREEVTRHLAWYIYQQEKADNDAEKAKLVSEAKTILRNDVDVELVLKEVNGMHNQDFKLQGAIPKIQLSLSMFPSAGDAYMYFAKYIKDGDDMKRVPCLISNHKKIIRLDLLKKKTPESLLLIDNKYELPEEVQVQFINESILSLQQTWVERWLDNEIDEEKLLPANIIQEIEGFIKLTYYASDDTVKVIALWIYSTYFYQLFRGGFPYIFINGHKGSGKTTLDKILKLLCFNPMFTVSTSEAALYRHLNLTGGTFILDEMENLADAKKNEDSPMATVLKSGYSYGGEIFRTDKDSGFPKGFDAFGPKAISNINGLEDVMEDRCIPIYTVTATEQQVKNLQDLGPYFEEKRGAIYDISSRAAISALLYFREAHKIYHGDTRLDTGNLRMTQILRPLISIAKLVGGDYKASLIEYYNTTVRESKQNTKMETIEGKIQQVLMWISEDMLKIGKRKHVIGLPHAYNGLTFDEDVMVFEIDTLMMKVLIQEIDPDKVYPLKEVNQKMRAVLGKEFDYESNRIKTKAKVEDEGLLRQMNNQRYPQVYRYSLNARNFISPSMENKMREKEEQTSNLF